MFWSNSWTGAGKGEYQGYFVNTRDISEKRRDHCLQKSELKMLSPDSECTCEEVMSNNINNSNHG